MRRSDREITDTDEILKIIEKCRVMTIAIDGGEYPYAVSLNFGYKAENGSYEFYFHSAKEGEKLDRIKQCSRVCLTMNCDGELLRAEKPCAHGFLYKSVTAFGNAETVENDELKKEYLQRILKHQTGREFELEDRHAKSVAVVKISVNRLTAKARKE